MPFSETADLLVASSRTAQPNTGELSNTPCPHSNLPTYLPTYLQALLNKKSLPTCSLMSHRHSHQTLKYAVLSWLNAWEFSDIGVWWSGKDGSTMQLNGRIPVLVDHHKAKDMENSKGMRRSLLIGRFSVYLSLSIPTGGKPSPLPTSSHLLSFSVTFLESLPCHAVSRTCHRKSDGNVPTGSR